MALNYNFWATGSIFYFIFAFQREIISIYILIPFSACFLPNEVEDPKPSVHFTLTVPFSPSWWCLHRTFLLKTVSSIWIFWGLHCQTKGTSTDIFQMALYDFGWELWLSGKISLRLLEASFSNWKDLLSKPLNSFLFLSKGLTASP